MREIRLSGSEGGEAGPNRPSLPLSKPPVDIFSASFHTQRGLNKPIGIF